MSNLLLLSPFLLLLIGLMDIALKAVIFDNYFLSIKYNLEIVKCVKQDGNTVYSIIKTFGFLSKKTKMCFSNYDIAVDYVIRHEELRLYLINNKK